MAPARKIKVRFRQCLFEGARKTSSPRCTIERAPPDADEGRLKTTLCKMSKNIGLQDAAVQVEQIPYACVPVELSVLPETVDYWIFS